MKDMNPNIGITTKMLGSTHRVAELLVGEAPVRVRPTAEEGSSHGHL